MSAFLSSVARASLVTVLVATASTRASAAAPQQGEGEPEPAVSTPPPPARKVSPKASSTAAAVAETSPAAVAVVMEEPPTPPAAPIPPEAPKPPPPDVRTRGPFTAELGTRLTVLGDGGFEPYAEGDVLAQIALGFSWAPFRTRRSSLALLAEWDVGSRREQARGDEASLTLHRLSLGVVGKFAIARRLEAFVKVAPAAIHVRGSITDNALDRPLVSRSWTFGLDTTAGANLFLGSANNDKGAEIVGFWLSAEGGYSFAGRTPMLYAPADDEEDPRRFGEIELPSLKPSGAVIRLGVGISF